MAPRAQRARVRKANALVQAPNVEPVEPAVERATLAGTGYVLLTRTCWAVLSATNARFREPVCRMIRHNVMACVQMASARINAPQRLPAVVLASNVSEGCVCAPRISMANALHAKRALLREPVRRAVCPSRMVRPVLEEHARVANVFPLVARAAENA